MQLYKLRAEYAELILMTDEDGVLPEEVIERLDKNEDELETKTENICIMIQGYENDIDNINKEIKRLQSYKKTVTNNQESLKNYLEYNLQSLNKDTVNAGTFKVGFRKSKSVNIEDWILLEDKYTTTKTTVAPNKTQIMKDLKEWIEIEGCSIREKENLFIK